MITVYFPIFSVTNVISSYAERLIFLLDLLDDDDDDDDDDRPFERRDDTYRLIPLGIRF